MRYLRAKLKTIGELEKVVDCLSKRIQNQTGIKQQTNKNFNRIRLRSEKTEKTDSEVMSMATSSPPRRPMYYVQTAKSSAGLA